MKFYLARVWLSDGTCHEVATFNEWCDLPHGVVFVAQMLPQGINPLAPADYYWVSDDGEIQPYIGGGPALSRMMVKRGHVGDLDGSTIVKAGETIMRAQYNAIMAEALAWAKPCEGC